MILAREFRFGSDVVKILKIRPDLWKSFGRFSEPRQRSLKAS